MIPTQPVSPRVDNQSTRGEAARLPTRIVALTHTSREVSWSLAHEALWPIVERALRVGALPLIGTHDWLDLPTSDPRRVGAIYLAADQWALHLENQTSAIIDASREISISRSAEAQRQLEHERWLQANPWAMRRPA
ncbi:DUF2742 domain-containing protein [Gordonia sputi]|uniref:DUF2742 domain-containing protein n=1 Tax=Gordonia sputi NBRC 100414 TaxID=1089453 RepID=H5TYF3_9ACTN|nr:DUF2742 domain-containing protein [Gordonia sputi]NKY92750.1 DUF2742 domain-containing protein [Gordonia sputi]GAB38511.1 hypothetical protein GOSPT_045_01490 [Gordonia sputi NBRC 100414]